VALLAPRLLTSAQRGPAALPGGDALRPEQKAAAAQYWHMCPSADTCGQQRMLQWRQSPAALAGSVAPDLHHLPGLQSAMLQQVLQKWAFSPPAFRGTPVTLKLIADFMVELLQSDPFGTGAQVPYVDFQGPGDSKVVAITQRQLAFVVANVLMGNGLSGARDGLSGALEHCGTTSSTAYIYSLLSLLAVLSQELHGGQHGTVIVGATPRHRDDSWRSLLESSTLQEPTLCFESEGGQTDCGLPDFMSGGTDNQALTDIAGGVVGGGGQLCDVADSQDESLVQFYSEVLAFSFYVSSQKMLPVPWALLGTRSYLRGLTGSTGENGKCGSILDDNWLKDDPPPTITPVSLNGATAYMIASSFVAVASKGGEKCPVELAKNNNCASQRHHVDEDLGLWYQAFSRDMYNEVVRPAFGAIVSSVGTGPWGAGVWWGDSHQYFLAVWLATSLLGGTRLDYYVYSHFCENPGNQCFVLGADGCKDCIQRAGNTGVDPAYCGSASVQDVVARFRGRSASDLYMALKTVADPPGQVFDQLASHAGAAR